MKPLSVRKTQFLFAGIALWYGLFVPVTNVNSTVGYFARVAIVLVGLALVALHGIRRVYAQCIRLKETGLIALVTTCFLYVSVASVDPSKFVDYVTLFGGIAGLSLLAARYPVDADTVILYVGIGLVAPILLEVAGVPVTGDREFDLLPFRGESWRVVIRAVHFTGRAGFFLLFAALLKFRQARKPWHYLLLAVGLYLIIFSGSRNSIAAAMAVLGMWALPPAQRFLLRHPAVALVSVVVAGASMYLLPVLIFQALSAGGFIGRVLQITPENTDVTSGRLLTWLYHLDLFFQNPWTGVSTEMVSEAGETVSEKLKASNESFFTKVLAANGMFGMLYYGLFLFMGWLAVRKNSAYAYMLMVAFVVITAADGVYGVPYKFHSIIGYALFFSLLRNTDTDRHSALVRGRTSQMRV
jgi:hypothetical protein